MSAISITKGDMYKFTVTVKDSAGDIFDLTGYTMVFTAKDDLTKLDVDAAIQSTATIPTPVNGVGEFTLEPTDTNIDAKEYHYDIQISDGSNNVYTVVKDSSLIITDQVTMNT